MISNTDLSLTSKKYPIEFELESSNGYSETFKTNINLLGPISKFTFAEVIDKSAV